MNFNIDHFDLESQLTIFNWFYKLGSPLISDVKYNQLFNEFKHARPESSVVTETWSELERPTDLLIKSNLHDYSLGLEKSLREKTDRLFFLPTDNMRLRARHYSETVEYFDRFVPKSIETIDDINDSKEWYKTVKGNKPSININFSLKADGFNISLFYYEGHFIGARTRGRSGNSEDVTIAMSHVVPMKLNTKEMFVRIKTEAVMHRNSLETLRKMDPSREWKSPRNSIRTLLMNDIGEQFNKFIIPLGFKVEGINFPSRKEELKFLEDCNIKTVYNASIQIDSHEKLIETVRYFSEYESAYHTDGCVVTLDDYSVFNEFDTSGKYDYGMRAYRLFNWQSNLYCSVLLDLIPSYNSKRISLKISVLPTKVSNGSTIRNLDVDNLNRLQRLGLKKGSVVCFDIKSDSCVDLLDNETKLINNCVQNCLTVPEQLKVPYQILEDRVKGMIASGEFNI